MPLKHKTKEHNYPVIQINDEEIDLIDLDSKINWTILKEKLKTFLDFPLSNIDLASYAALLIIVYNFEKINTRVVNNTFNNLYEDTPVGDDYRYFVKNIYNHKNLKQNIFKNIYDVTQKNEDLKKEFMIEGGNLLKKRRVSMHGIDNTNKWKPLI